MHNKEQTYYDLGTQCSLTMGQNKSVYFIGIGGIGMSAIARYFAANGYDVSGYDKTPTELTDALISEGIKIHFKDDVNLLDKEAEFVVYTPAVPKEHRELMYYKDNKYSIKKRSEVLGNIMWDYKSICVAGTHGKTTTSSMIAHILRDSEFGCTAFLGGIATNYNSNFWGGFSDYAVAEADEYDRSFLKLYPDIAVITSMEPDHLDIYGNEKNMQDAFIEFSKNVKSNGLLICSYHLPRLNEIDGNVLTYGINTNADCKPENIVVENGTYKFDFVSKSKKIKDIQLNMGGRHNVENATAAITVALHLGIDEGKIKNAIKNFKGVKRRFQFIVKTSEKVFIDDYAHHPGELNALLAGAKDLYPNKKITIVFQPHLYSRTKDFAKQFGESLSAADEIIILPIYPARELPIENISSETIAGYIQKPARIIEKNDLVNEIKKMNPEVLITAGAGDIDKLVEPIKNIFS